MAQDFNATSSKIVTGFSSHSTLRTYSVWIYAEGQGEGNLGRIFDKRTASGEVELLHFSSSVNLQFTRQTGGSWFYAQPTFNQWVHICVTYDSGSISNDPKVYYDGVERSVTGESNPSSIATNADPYVIGNRSNDNARTWDGGLAEFAIYDRILTQEEITSLAKGYSPLFNPRGLVFYADLVRDLKDVKGTGTLTGTDVSARSHPRIIYPNQLNFLPATAVGGGGNNYTKTLDDTIGLTENVSMLTSRFKTVSDTITLTSTVATVATLLRTLTDSFSISSAVTTLRVTSVSVSDSIGLSSAVTAAKTTSKTFSDSIGLTEAFTLVKSFGRSFSDSIGLSSAVETLIFGTKGLFDSISLTDTLSIILNSLSAGIPGKFKDAIRSIQKVGAGVTGIFKNNDPEGISFGKDDRPEADEVR